MTGDYREIISHLRMLKLPKEDSDTVEISMRYGLSDLENTAKLFNLEIEVYAGNPKLSSNVHVDEDFLYNGLAYTVVCGSCVFAIDFDSGDSKLEYVLTFEGVSPTTYHSNGVKKIIYYQTFGEDYEVGEDGNTFEVVEKVTDLKGVRRVLTMKKLVGGVDEDIEE